ncbi:MAG: DUF63 family protein [Candidatus Thermoplasmatota archaeon]
MIIVTGGIILYPSVFYDQWIWRYYWGPIVADASGHPVSYNNVTAYEGYTTVSEITYGLILIFSIIGLYALIRKIKVKVDWFFCLSLLPYILFGSVARVLEDTSYFYEPFSYWFISPLIYVQIAIYALVFLFVGYIMVKANSVSNIRSCLLISSSVLIIVNVIYCFIYIFGVNYGEYILHPVEFLILSVISFTFFFYRCFRRDVTLNTFLFSGGLLCLSPSLYLIMRWLFIEQWAQSSGIRVDVFLLVMSLVSFCVLGIYLLSYLFRDIQSVDVYREPFNLAMVYGHLLDGFSSYISIYDPLHMNLPSYMEKHPMSNIILEVWPPLYPIVKLIMIIIIIYLFDVLYKREMVKYSNFVNLLKIGVFILGFSPGLRDLLRVTLGV